MSETTACQFHDRFSQALLDGDVEQVAPLLADPSALKRFAVYRNNVVRGAIEALRAAYPAVNRLVGDAFFSPMAHSYWQSRPPTARTMTFYGEGFAEHIDAYPPAQGLPYLSDVARHDRAWLEAHHAADGPPLSADAMTRLDPDQLPALAPGLHQSVQLLSSPWRSYEIWRSNRYQQDAPSGDMSPGRYLSVLWRKSGEVHHAAVTPAEWAFLSALQVGACLEAAAGALHRDDSAADPASAFGSALAAGQLGSNV
jgi:hypothetical protein